MVIEAKKRESWGKDSIPSDNGWIFFRIEEVFFKICVWILKITCEPEPDTFFKNLYLDTL